MLLSWNWIKDYLGDTALTAEAAAELLGAHAFEIEGLDVVEGDTIIDVDVLPNRSSDCLCHRGIAREVASASGVPLENDPLETSVELPQTGKVEVDIEDEKLCPRFTAMVIEGVEVKESPEWLQERLKAIGQRPINNIVDATNYVMFSIGQPMHAYDADLFPQVDGKWQFEVRKAIEGEEVSLLGEKGSEEDRTIVLENGELLIVDKSNNTPIGLAGVKGGRFAGVHDDTKRVIVEAAHFDPITTRQTARRHHIVIDSSKRFENRPSPLLPPYAQQMIADLLRDIAGGEVIDYLDHYEDPWQPSQVLVRPRQANDLIGSSLSEEVMERLLTQAGIMVENSEEGFLCAGPKERTDLSIEEDFIEEIGRLYGYDHVESVLPEPLAVPEYNERHIYSELIREHLIERGFSEVITSSFRKKDQLQLQNALASDKSYLRSSLVKNIAEVLDKNTNLTDLLGIDVVKVFEIGTVFKKGEGDVEEEVMCALGVRVRPSGYSGKEDALLDTELTALQEVLGVEELSVAKEKGVGEFSLTKLLAHAPKRGVYAPVEKKEGVSYRPFSLFPAMSRDIAMWVPESTSPQDVLAELKSEAGPLCVRATHIDEFQKDGKVSLAFRLVFQADDRTLTDIEVNEVMDQVYKKASQEGWETR